MIFRTSLVLFTGLFVSHARAAGAPSGPRPRIRPSNMVVASLGCADELTRIVGAVERALDQLQARKGSVYLTTFTELNDALTHAGGAPTRVREMVKAVADVKHLVDAHPILRYAGEFMTRSLYASHVFTCVVGATCRLAQPEANHLLHTGIDKQAVVLMPLTKADPTRFAINFWSTTSAIAAEQFMYAWLSAGHELNARRPGRADPIWRTFVSPTYRGGLPIPGETFDRGFVMAFLTLFQAYVSCELYQGSGLEGAEVNRRHASRLIIDQLYSGPAGHLTGPYVKRLGLTEANVMDRFGSIVHAMADTIDASAEVPHGAVVN